MACEPEWQSLAQTLGGDKIDSFSATTAFQDPHHIEARPSLIVKARHADIIFCTGADLEIGWLPLLLTKSANPLIQSNQPGYFMASDQVELIEKPSRVDRSQGDVHAAGNPHVHWDPYRVLKIAEAFSSRLQTIDSVNSRYYQQRLVDFTSTWQAAINTWESQASTLKNKRVIVYHKNWSYLLNWLQIDVIADLEPKPGVPPSSAHLTSLLELVRGNSDVDSILIANYQNDRGAKWLSKKSGIAVIDLPFTVGGNKNSDDLISLYNDVVLKLKNEL